MVQIAGGQHYQQRLTAGVLVTVALCSMTPAGLELGRLRAPTGGVGLETRSWTATWH